MPSFDASNAECFVYSYKQGIAARVGHDLKISVTRFQIEISEDGDSIHATFDPRSLQVICARKNGQPNFNALSDADKEKIQHHLFNDVLDVTQYSKIEFRSTQVQKTDSRAQIEGELTLHGHTRRVHGSATLDSGKWIASFQIQQPDFGIKPFSAMLGALRVAPRVDIETSVPA